MDDIIKIWVGALTALIGSFSSGLLIIKYILKRIVDSRFLQLEKSLAERIELQAEITKQYVEIESGVYPNISEIVYRAKNGADCIRKARTNIELINEEIVFSCRELTEQLRRFRLYLPVDIFNDLHKYKHMLQDILVISDILTRPDNSKAVRELTEETQQKLTFLCDNISSSCDNIIAKLKDRVRKLQGPINPDK